MTTPGGSDAAHEHELERILAAITPTARRLADAGHQAFLVGGVVRDLQLLDDGDDDADVLHDIDLTTDARPPAIKAALEPFASALWSQGERFGTIAAHVDGRSVEVTTHRAEAYDPESRKPVVTFGDDLHTDLSRRDFTINAMAIDVIDRTLHDPFGGLEDLVQRRLRTPLDPEISFSDDPLRMLRAARFIARFDLQVDPGLMEAATRLAERLSIVSRERIQDELEKLLAVDAPGRGLQFLLDTGLLAHVVPGLDDDGSDRDQVPLVDRTCAARGGTGRRAALVWPLGPERIRTWLVTLRYSGADRSETVSFVHGAARILAASDRDDDPSTMLRRLAADVGDAGVDEVLVLAAAVSGRSLEPLEAALDRLRATEDLDDLSIPMGGVDIMDLLGIQPGIMVGEATDVLRSARLDEGPLTRMRAEELLRSWWTDRPPE